MILRRISQGIKNQDWFVVGIEVMIVVVGIFIGLQVDDWNEGRKNKEATKVYYRNLLEDLRTEKKSRDARIAYLRTVQSFAQFALQKLQKTDEPKSSDYWIALYQASQRWSYSGVRTTYNDLLSGNISSSIPNVQMRLRLANYYTTMEITQEIIDERTPYRNNIRMYLPARIQYLVRQNCGDVFKFDELFNEQSNLPETCNITIDDDLQLEASKAIREYDDLEKHLIRRLDQLEGKAVILAAYDGLNKELQKHLENLL